MNAIRPFANNCHETATPFILTSLAFHLSLSPKHAKVQLAVLSIVCQPAPFLLFTWLSSSCSAASSVHMRSFSCRKLPSAVSVSLEATALSATSVTAVAAGVAAVTAGPPLTSAAASRSSASSRSSLRHRLLSAWDTHRWETVTWDRERKRKKERMRNESIGVSLVAVEAVVSSSIRMRTLCLVVSVSAGFRRLVYRVHTQTKHHWLRHRERHTFPSSTHRNARTRTEDTDNTHGQRRSYT